MRKNETLEKLKLSLERERRKPSPQPVAAEPPAARTGEGASQPSRCEKLTVTIYQQDAGIIREVMAAALAKGRKVNASLAVRLALRSLQVDDALLSGIQALEAEDLRRRRGQTA